MALFVQIGREIRTWQPKKNYIFFTMDAILNFGSIFNFFSNIIKELSMTSPKWFNLFKSGKKYVHDNPNIFRFFYYGRHLEFRFHIWYFNPQYKRIEYDKSKVALFVQIGREISTWQPKENNIFLLWTPSWIWLPS
jgi:hypothetical protein